MHPTRDTYLVIYLERFGRGGPGVRTASGNHHVREQSEDNQKTDCCHTTAKAIAVAGDRVVVAAASSACSKATILSHAFNCTPYD